MEYDRQQTYAKQPEISDDETIVSAAWSLTVGGASSRVGPNCPGTAGIADETGAIIGVGVDTSVVVGT